MIARASWQVEKCVDLGYGDALGPIGDLRDFVACAYLAFLNHSKVKAGTVMRDKKSGHGRIAHSDAHAVARHARLGHLEERAANPVAIANAHFVISQAVDRKIFAELPESKIVPAEIGFPVAIGVRLIHHHGAMFSAVSGQIALPVAIYIQAPDHLSSRHGLFPDAGMHRLSPPGDVPRKTDVD